MLQKYPPVAVSYLLAKVLHEDPLLFFTLRQADTEELVARAVQEKTGDLLARANKKSSRVIDEADLSGLFGIDLDVKPDFSAAAKPQAPKRPPCGKKAASAPVAEQAPEVKTVPTATALIEGIVRQNPSGTTVVMLEEATGFPRSKIYAVTSRLRQQGRISYVAQGVYGRS